MISTIKPDFLIEGMSLENQGLYSLTNSWPVLSGYESGGVASSTFSIHIFLPPHAPWFVTCDMASHLGIESCSLRNPLRQAIDP